MSVNTYAPKTMPELSAALGALTPESKIIGGGTDLIIKLTQGTCTPDALLYLGELEGAQDIIETSEGLEIGAMATMTALAECPFLTGPYAAIGHAAVDVGAWQIRNRATIGGNLANASPAGDLAPALFLLNAEVLIAGPGGTRREPIDKVILGPMKTSLQFNEAIVRFFIPRVPSQTAKSAFIKLGYRKALTISRIGLAAMLDVDENGVTTQFELIAGAISLTPVHVKKAETYLIGKKPSQADAAQVGQFLSDLILEITPEIFDRDYKVEAAFGVTEDLFAKLI